MTITEVLGEKGSNKTCRTFVLEDEGHTLGGLLQNIISQYEEVDFCGYAIPHPSEKKIHLRIQTRGLPAVDILKQAFTDLEKTLAHIGQVFEQEVTQFKTNRGS